MNERISKLPEVRIEPVAPWGFPDLKELNHYRDLIFFMVWRGIKAAYAQSVGGYAWAIVQPAMQIIVFSLIFGGLLGLDGGDDVPYPLFVTVAIIPWSYLSATVTGTSSALITNSGMLAKVYFPRIIFLLTPALGNLVSFTISFILVIGVLIIYQVPLTLNLLMLPLLIILMMLTPLAFGLWLSSMAIRFRDFNIAMGNFLRMLIYIVPVMYASEEIPEDFRRYYILNPLVGVIEGFKSCLLGVPFYWDSLITSTIITFILLLSGAVYFRRMERIIVDVI